MYFDEKYPIQGLSQQEVAERLNKYGYNDLTTVKNHTFLRTLFNIIIEPMFILLFICSIIYFIIGDHLEALMLLSFVVIIITITVIQTRKTERTLKTLRNLSSPRALVIRDGSKQRIAGRDVVRDDIILLSEGDRIPTDAVILQSFHLSVDESMLTGESFAVPKYPYRSKLSDLNYMKDHSSIVFAGTLVVKGNAICQVIRTGQETELAKIGKSLQTIKIEKTNVQKQTNHIIKIFSIVGLSLSLILILIYGINMQKWVDAIIAGITMAMAILPEELPVVLTVFLALGAWRISQWKVLTRHLPAVEMLGATTVLCVDKTGTLTLNQMSVSKILINNNIYDIDDQLKTLPEELHEIVEISILASPTDPFDPMEKAMKELGIRTLSNTEHLHHNWQLLREYPLSEKLMAMSRVWQSPTGDELIIAAKGSPEAIADLCHFSSIQMDELRMNINCLAEFGLRIIGVAFAKFPITALPSHQHYFKFKFIGLLGLTDPIRPEVKNAIRECYEAGIKVIMITGDYPKTALKIAQQIGLNDISENIITGDELDLLTEADLQRKIKSTTIFARVTPQQKLRIVKSLKSNYEIVAMTGDGVNDAPALKAADIGIAMGKRGTDVAREAAALVLLDDNFTSLVSAIRTGRRVFDNLKKAISYIFAVHIPIVGMSIIPTLFKLPLALLPMHIVFLELIIDPACSIVFEMEPAEKNIMKRPPRKFNEPLFDHQMIFLGLLQGIIILGVVALIYIIALRRGFLAEQARTFAFIMLVLGNIGLIFLNRSRKELIIKTLNNPNKALWIVFISAIFFLSLTVCFPFLRNLFKFYPPTLKQIFICLLITIFSIAFIDMTKIFYYSKLKK